MALDEKALRREGFSEGPRVKLGDGQEWTFPRPHLSMFTQIAADGRVEAGWSASYGKAYADRLDDLIACPDPFERTCIKLELAVTLLLRNYDLDNTALRRLVSFETDGTNDPEMWLAIEGVLLGLDLPKPSVVGSTSASEPTTSTPMDSP